MSFIIHVELLVTTGKIPNCDIFHYISVVFISSIYLSEHMSRIYAWLPAVSYQRMAAIGLAADVFYAYVFNE